MVKIVSARRRMNITSSGSLVKSCWFGFDVTRSAAEDNAFAAKVKPLIMSASSVASALCAILLRRVITCRSASHAANLKSGLACVEKKRENARARLVGDGETLPRNLVAA